VFTERTPRVVAARRLLRRRDREKAGRFLAEGPQAVREAVAAGVVQEVFCTQAALDRHSALLSGAPVSLVTDRGLEALTETQTPQGLVAVCSTVDRPLDEVAGRLVAVVADIRDPGNAGTVLRCADAAGADAVVFAGEAVDPYNGKAVRASAGSLFHLPVIRGVTAVDTAKRLQASGFQVLAAAGDGPDSLDDLADSGELAKPTAWLFGNEAHGLPADIPVDRRVRIPIYGKAESLNLATAAAICLYASARAQR
jgi:RNA methyltransferase, TrmH family